MKQKKLLFSLTRKDFELETFTVGGHGGGSDTSRNGVRLRHNASGAVGEGREHRSLDQNRQAALERLVASNKFKIWHKLECARRLGQFIPETEQQIKARVDKMVDEGIKNGTIIIEEY